MSSAGQLGNISKSFFLMLPYSMCCEESITPVGVFILSQAFCIGDVHLTVSAVSCFYMLN